LLQVDVVRPVMPLIALALTVVLCAVPVAQVASLAKEIELVGHVTAGVRAEAGRRS
jgi:hypothetical protein